jgi:hypothetical protein
MNEGSFRFAIFGKAATIEQLARIQRERKDAIACPAAIKI